MQRQSPLHAKMTEDLREVAIKKLEFSSTMDSQNTALKETTILARQRSNVSNLSLLSKKDNRRKGSIKKLFEEQQIRKYRKIHTRSFLRSYWKGWLEGRKEIWKKYKDELIELGQLYSRCKKKISKMH